MKGYMQKWCLAAATCVIVFGVIGLPTPEADEYKSGYGRGFVPKDGFVPDEATAILVAEAILMPIYSKAQIISERPFTATLHGDIWVVSGHLDEKLLGGVAEIHISKSDCKILFVIHGS